MSIRKRGRSWRAEVCVKGKRTSATFDTRAQAESWKAKQKGLLEAGIYAGTGTTVQDMLDRYDEEVTSKKTVDDLSGDWSRLKMFAASSLATVRLTDLSAAHIAVWKKARLEAVSPGTCRRDLTLLSAICSLAVREWHWLEINPCKGVARPKEPEHRDRILNDEELQDLLKALDYEEGKPIKSVKQRTALAVLFALETAMRRGEICNLRTDQITGRVARLPKTKNGKRRDVPLSKRALEILQLVGPDLFQMRPDSVTQAFNRAVKKASIEDLRFHDLRHTAITRLARKLPVMDLARMTGHKDLKMLMVYYNASAESIADLL